MPDNRRTTVKLEGSIVLFPNAIRHNTEFAANATSANTVYEAVFARVRARASPLPLRTHRLAFPLLLMFLQYQPHPLL